MYPTFLLYGMFIFSAIFILIISIGMILDIACFLFPTVKANILSKKVVAISSRKSYFGNLYELFIEYQYQYKGVTYKSTMLNGFNNVRSYSLKKLDKILDKSIITEDEISVHVCPFYPKIAYVLPFKWDKLIILPIASLMLAVLIFSGSKLNIF